MRLLLSVLLSFSFASSAFASGIFGIADVYEPDSILDSVNKSLQSNETQESSVVSTYVNYLEPSLQAELFETLRLGTAEKDGLEVVSMDTQRKLDFQKASLREIINSLALAKAKQWMIAVDESYLTDKNNPAKAIGLEHLYVPIARLKASEVKLRRAGNAIDILSKSTGVRLARVCKSCNSLGLKYIMNRAEEDLAKTGDKDIILDLRIMEKGDTLQSKTKFFKAVPEKELMLDPRKLYTQVKVTDSEQSLISLPQTMVLNSAILDKENGQVIGNQAVTYSQVIVQGAIPKLTYQVKDDEAVLDAPETLQRFFYIYSGISAFEARVNSVIDKAMKEKKMIAFTPVADDRFALSMFRVSDKAWDENAIVSFDSTDEASKRTAMLAHFKSQLKEVGIASFEDRFHTELQGLNEEEKLEVLAEIMLNNNGGLPSLKQVLKQKMIKNYMDTYHPEHADQAPSDEQEIEYPEFEYDLQEEEQNEELSPVSEESVDSSMDAA